jgi:signal transduction histidine kinase/ActR/RegA family two-component response regulator
MRPAAIPDGVVLVAKNGVEIPIDDSAAPIRNDDGRLIGAVLVFRDITEKKHMEAEVLKSLKLESLGLLAGGIAHDFNNILTGVLTNVSFVKEATEKKSAHYQLLVDAEYAVLRAKDLTHQLLTFAKGGAPVKKVSSISDILRDTATFILAGSVCRCDIDIEYGLWHADVDSGQISQVIQNLLLNAIQAMPQGGVITLSAQNMKIVSGSVTGLPAGNYIKISVHDTGIGIDPRYLTNIFDPYFTTKAKGSGLGLATSYSIVKKHNGIITVESQLGKGTVFYIYLPAAVGPLAMSDQPGCGESIGKLNARVLIMDDEDMILSTAKNILVAAGCSVDCAVNGDEVIVKYKQAKGLGKPYDVLILDLVIPAGLGGKETMAILRELDSGLKAIVSSGYSNDPVMADFSAYGFKGIIPKPYTAQELIRAVYSVVKDKGK